MKKQFLGDRTSNPFVSTEALSQAIDNARDITKATFLKYCDIGKVLRRDMEALPGDYTYGKCGNIYFFTWDSIEYFYI